MTSDPGSAPRLGVALPEGPLRTRLLDALAEAGVDVVPLDPDSSTSRALERTDLDVVVVGRRDLDPSHLERDDDAAQRSVVVISEDEGAHERVAWLSSGAAQVLDRGAGPDRLARSLEAIAEAAADGGSGGPEGRDPDAEPRLADFISRSPYMQSFLDVVRQVVDASSTLLITGETGVGKERLARAIHAESPRADGRFVSVNCGALPEALLESELFGHVRGAFTGADRNREGVFEAAHGGTLFLDEVGEMPVSLQVKLLTALQRREVTRLGTATPVPVDARIIAATNRDLRERIEAGEFREDLYYRLAVIPLEVPPLRERPEDLPDLVGGLIRYFRDALPTTSVVSCSAEALEALGRYAWPGNVRELINVVERGMLLSEGTDLTLDVLPDEVRAVTQTTGAPLASTPRPSRFADKSLREVRDEAVEAAERAYLTYLLSVHAGRIAPTAEAAGISTRALYDRLKRYSIDKADFRRP